MMLITKFITLISIFTSTLLVLSAPVQYEYFEGVLKKELVLKRSFTIPIRMRESLVGEMLPSERLAQLKRAHFKTLFKYTNYTNEHIITKRDAQGFVQVGDMSGDNTYYASIQIGTPPVTFEVALDTGSADLVLVSSPCSFGCSSDTPLYNAKDSSTAITSTRPYAINYQVGSDSGTIAQDRMEFGGFTVANQYFGAVTSTTDTVGLGGVSGVFGLAFQPLSTVGGSMPFVESLWKNGLLDENVFTFAPARWGEASTGVSPGGIMTLGYINSTLFTGAINYIKVTSIYFWMIPLDDIMINGISLKVTTQQVNIDSGTTNIYVPLSVATLIYQTIPGSNAVANGIYTYPCSLNISISFQFGGIYYSIQNSDFNIGPADNINRNCYGLIGSIGPMSNGLDQYIFGDAFLKNVYTVFKFDTIPTVGFATLANPSGLKVGSVPIGNASSAGSSSSSSASNSIATSIINIAPLSLPATNYVVEAISQATNSTLIAPPVSIAALPNPIVVSLASKIQAALVEHISRLVRNTVMMISCPRNTDRTEVLWTCN